jgi:hypothetical protein
LRDWKGGRGWWGEVIEFERREKVRINLGISKLRGAAARNERGKLFV